MGISVGEKEIIRFGRRGEDRNIEIKVGNSLSAVPRNLPPRIK